MNIRTNIFTPGLFPTYWKEKKGNVLIIRLSEEQGKLVYGTKKFQSENKTHFGNKMLFENRLTSFKEISEEEFITSK